MESLSAAWQYYTLGLLVVISILSQMSMKREGLIAPDLRGIQEFNECILESSLSDAGFEGSCFTWSNNQQRHHRIWQRLDRILVNGETMQIWD